MKAHCGDGSNHGWGRQNSENGATTINLGWAAAKIYALHHRMETVNNLASSTLSGVGMAIGGCLGSALILRFKAARSYIRSVLKDLQ
jgi:hypothetical protein